MMISMRSITIITLILLLEPCIFGKMTRLVIPMGRRPNQSQVLHSSTHYY